MSFEGVSSIGRNVARYRRAAKISGEELAQRAGEGLTRSVIANLENGRKDDVTVRQLMALSAALHVPPVALVADVFDPGAPSAYPLPAFNASHFDAQRGEVVIERSLDRNYELLEWFTGQSMRVPFAEAAPATRLAASGVHSVRDYMVAYGRFATALKRFALHAVDESDDESTRERDYLDFHVQTAAESVIRAIEAARRADVAIADGAEAHVYEAMESVGLRYQAPSFEDPF